MQRVGSHLALQALDMIISRERVITIVGLGNLACLSSALIVVGVIKRIITDANVASISIATNITAVVKG